MIESKDFKTERLFGINFDVLTMADAVDWVIRNVAIGHRSAMRYVVTPNVSLTMLHQDSAEFRKVIHHADLKTVDGSPLVRASKLLGKPLPERVAGSDLVLELFQAAIEESPLRVFFLGAAPGVAERAANAVHAQWPGVKVVGTLSPDFGFENDEQANFAIVKIVNATEPDVLVIGFGAPKQETWAFEHRHALRVPVALCVGGTIDFIAGEQRRAPVWVRKIGVEWCWRLAMNPRRLFNRYFRDALRLPRLFCNEVEGCCPTHEADSDHDASGSSDSELRDAAGRPMS